jgi:hypothetical protein
METEGVLVAPLSPSLSGSASRFGLGWDLGFELGRRRVEEEGSMKGAQAERRAGEGTLYFRLEEGLGSGCSFLSSFWAWAWAFVLSFSPLSQNILFSFFFLF